MSTTTDSMHTTSSKLEDQAASAALRSNKDSRPKRSPHPALDEDGKLTSAGAATSLKYARAQDLPSFPSAGGRMSAAGAAASLADSNKKSFEHWKPGATPAANKAANQAKDYQMEPLWEPERSKPGQSAATQALNTKPPGAITERDAPPDSRQKALLAATASMKEGRRRADSAPVPPQQDNSWALKAATNSHRSPDQPFASGDPGFEAARIQNMSKKNINRQMYGSKPPVAIEVEEQTRQAALKASAIAMARKMYAIQQSHIEEAKAAKRTDGRNAARTSHNRNLSDSGSVAEGDETESQHQYYNLEEAARKLAQARLARIHDEHEEYRQYYGAQAPSTRSRLSMRGFRRRASSDGQRDQVDDNSDEERSRNIRSQMSIFQGKLAAVDDKKRQSDRDALLVAARKNVDKSMNAMDEKVFADTGKMSPQQRELWEKTARDRAQKDSDNRMVNHGKVHIGGGKYLDQSEVDAIARARLQPTLDEISEKAEAQRAQDEALRLEEEKRKREAEAEKTRLAQAKAEERAAKQKAKAEQKAGQGEEKARLAEEKRVRKEEETKRKNEANAEKERLKAEKTKEPKGSRFGNVFGGATAGAAAIGGAAATLGEESAHMATTTGEEPDGHEKTTVDDDPDDDEDVDPTDAETPVKGQLAKADATDREAYSKDSGIPPARRPDGTEGADTKDDDAEDGVEENRFISSMPGEEAYKEDDGPTTTTSDTAAPTSPTSPFKRNSKVKGWFKSRFRSGSKSENNSDTYQAVTADTTESKAEPIEEQSRENSERDVAMAGRTDTNESDDMYGPGKTEKDEEEVTPATKSAPAAAAVTRSRSTSISSMSSSEYSKDVAAAPLPTGSAGAQDETARSTTSSEPSRGRRGFRERILSKITKDKETKETNPGFGQPPPTNLTSVYAAVTAPNTEEDGRVSAGGEGNDDFEEARDTFEEGKLSPATKLNTATDNGEGKALSPKGSREGSKFKEDL